MAPPTPPDASDAPAERRDYSVSMAAANVYALALILPLGALVLAGHAWAHGVVDLARGFDWWTDSWAWIPGLALGVAVHEALHGLAWKLAGGMPWSTITFGFQWKALTPYAHCRAPMGARAYRVGAVTPGVVLGLVPAAVGIATGWAAWTAFGFLFTVAAGGDALIVWLLRNVPGGWLVEDHPSQAGCFVYVPAADEPAPSAPTSASDA